MRSSILMSITLHAGLVVLSVFGLPHLQRDNMMQDVPMVVELVSISDETNLPSQPEPEPEPKKEEPKPAPPPPPEPEVKKSPPPPPPPPPPAAEPEPEVVVAPPPNAKPKPKAKPKTEPKKVEKPKPKPKAKPKAPTKLAKLKPRRKPKPPDEFESVLKNLAQEFKKPPPAKVTKKDNKVTPKKDDFEQQIAKVLTRRHVSDSNSSRITMTEMQAMSNTIRTAIQPCWNFQPGAKGAADTIVTIRATLSPDGTVRQAWVTNRAAFQNDPFKLSAAEAAQRAILNKRCQPFKLDPKKYDVWKDVTLNFNPSEMFGR